MGDNGAALLPTVKWAQRKDTLSLNVELHECDCPHIVLKSGSIEFEGVGVGAKGLHLYAFKLDFYKTVDAESCFRKLNGSGVEVLIKKEGAGEWWPKLTAGKTPHFLKLDFNKWKSESDDEEERKKGQMVEDIQTLKEEKERIKSSLEKSRSVYLVLYNMTQWVAHTYLFLLCAINLIQGGRKFVPLVFDHCAHLVQFGIMFSVMEIVHPLARMTRGPWLTPLLQTSGRAFAFLNLWLASDYIKHEWFVLALFMTWSSVELVRYPFYILQIIKRPSPVVTWLRYTSWILLYPMGLAFEETVYYNAAKTFDEHDMYILDLPNSLNFSLRLTWLIRLAMLTITIGIPSMMYYMWTQRCKIYRGKKYKQP